QVLELATSVQVQVLFPAPKKREITESDLSFSVFVHSSAAKLVNLSPPEVAEHPDRRINYLFWSL
ncbi:MAG TPA: hypothetical protein PK127_05805, partial [Clostridiales bacterium]|nr:hypothetical protein [Clostridiales bacterium]